MSVFLPKYTMPDRICLAMPICSAKGNGMSDNITISQFVVCHSYIVTKFGHFHRLVGLKVCPLHATYESSLLVHLRYFVHFHSDVSLRRKFTTVKKLILGQVCKENGNNFQINLRNISVPRQTVPQQLTLKSL
jgi:hypothetical protein